MKLNKNRVLAMVLSALILSVGIGVGVWSLGSPSTITITPPSMVKNSSFTISTDGTNFYSVNGSSSELFLQSTNASKVLGFSSGNLTSGGSIYINAGNYSLSQKWNITTPITVTGTGSATVLRLGDAVKTHCIETYAKCAFRDFTVDGNRLGQAGYSGVLYGIHVMEGSDGTEISNVNVTSVYGGGAIIRANHCKVFGGYYADNKDEDVEISNGGSYNVISSVTANGSGISNTRPSFWFTFNASNNIFSNCISQASWQGFGAQIPAGYLADGNAFIGCKAINPASDGFWFDTTTTGIINYTKIQGCTVNGSGGYAVNIVDSGVLNTEVSGNTFTDNALGSILDAGIYTQRWGNLGDDLGYENVASYSYIIYTDGVTTFMKNGTDGQIPHQNTNSSKVINFAIGNSTAGDSILIKNGNYSLTATVNLNKDVSLIGESLATTPSVVSGSVAPDDPITDMAGAVFSIPTNSINALTITGTRGSINIRNIGIHFLTGTTGHGVYSPAALDVTGLAYCDLNNIVVWNNDATHYAFWLVNFDHSNFDRLFSWGGPGFHLETSSTFMTFGISHFGLTYTQVLPTLTLTKNVYEIIGSSPTIWMAGIKFDRMQAMDKSISNTGSGLYLQYVIDSDFREVDIENPAKKMITMDQCKYVNIYNSFSFGGGITHTGCVFCGYWAGYFDTSWSGTYYNVTTDSGSDFFNPSVHLTGYNTTNFNFPRLQQGSSFIVYTMGSTYYLLNGASGQTELWSTNATYLFDYAVTHLPANGGAITVMSGIYSFLSTLNVTRDYVTIRGENAGSYLATPNGTVLRALGYSNKAVMNVSGSNFRMYDLTVDGEGADQSNTTDAFILSGSSNSLFSGVSFVRGGRCGANVSGGSFNTFRDCMFGYSIKYGASVEGANFYTTFDGCQFSTIGSGSNSTDVAGVAFGGTCIGGRVVNSKFNAISSVVTAVYYGYGIEELTATLSNTQYIGNAGYGCAQGLFAPILNPSTLCSGNSYYYTGTVGSGEPATTSYGLGNDAMGVSGFSYLVFTDGTSYFMRNGSTGRIDYSSTSAGAVLNNTIGNMSDIDGTIILAPDVLVTGTINITRGNLTIMSNTVGYDFYYDKQPTPQIQRLVINSTTDEIDKILLQGLTFNELLFSPYNHPIQEVTVRDCAIYKTGTWLGLVFSGSGYPSSGWFNNIRFESCRLTDKSADGATRGLVHFTNGYDWTELTFESCDFECDGNTNTYFFDDGTASVIMHLINPRFYIGGNGGTVRLFYDNSVTGTIQAHMNTQIIGGKIESDTNYTVLTIPASTNSKRVEFSMIGFEMGSYSTGVTVFNVTNTNWNSFRNFIIMQNCPCVGDATFSVGTLPAASSIMQKNIHANPYFVTENSGSSVNATDTTFSITHGLSGTPIGVWYSFNSTDILAAKWTSTSSTITVTVTGMASANYTCYWKAEYVP